MGDEPCRGFPARIGARQRADRIYGILDGQVYCSYIIHLALARDEAKRAANIAKHGLDFVSLEQFAWERALVRADMRFSYGEVRLVAVGPMESEADRLFTVVFTVERRAVRIISVRRASNREIRSYEAENQT